VRRTNGAHPKHSIDDAEDRRIGADAERQSENDGQSETPIPQKEPHALVQVPQE
jgi:hypothetical protein